jgi:hypothetical protein
MMSRYKKSLTIVLLAGIAVTGYVYLFTTPQVDFSTEVKPLLNRKCLSCHGGVKKKGDYSLLFQEEAMASGASGKPAIIPGDPENSELFRRLIDHDPEERMPYKEDPLTGEEIDLLKNWIKQGAKWGDHWAYLPVKPQQVPSPGGYLWGLIPNKKSRWIRNDIDRFILKEQLKNGLSAAQEADRQILARRVSLDLIGLPLSAEKIEAFVQDHRSDAYERLVDSLLASPAFGERWASMWMDLARYADTKGYERDDSRNIWRYRDFLIRSFNDDKPYDQFLTEQIAGDLLPNATDEQMIATAFHRNTMTNDEGGTDNEEFRTAAVIDRVNTTWEVLLGSSFACVQCHSHPYDPFRHEEYFRFMAFLNNTRDEDTYSEYPLLFEFRDEDSLRMSFVSNWLKTNASPQEAHRFISFLKTRQPAMNSLRADQFINSELSDTKWLVMRTKSSARIGRFDLSGRDRLLIRYDSRMKDGKLIVHRDSMNGPVLAQINVPETTGGWFHHETAIEPTMGLHDIYLSYENKNLKNPDQNGIRFDWFHFTNVFPGMGKQDYDTAFSAYNYLLQQGKAATTPILVENPEDMLRPTHVFERGNWLVKGEEVKPGVPASLNPMPTGAPNNRLGLAMWLVSKENPLTARTMVNRLWEQLFGQGLAETLEDLGTQGIPPTHQALMDHLAWTFMNEHAWSVKKLIREMVLSATYRQSSQTSPQDRAADPFNRWYARGPRVRLSAEQIRDQALAVGGLLSPKMFGRSVMPYQPEGVWQSPYNGQSWNLSPGEDRHRRAVYTFIKRTGPYPSMINFDGTAREVCLSRRIRTNTPLQALTTLNDPAFVEAARALTIRLRKKLGDKPPVIIAAAFKEAMGREIDPERLRVFLSLYDRALKGYQQDPEKTCEMVGIQDEHNTPFVAAMTVTCNALLNMDEFLTKN